LLEIPITGGTPRKLEQAQLSSRRQIYFHPDGKHVAFLSEFQGDDGVWLMENLPPLKGSK